MSEAGGEERAASNWLGRLPLADSAPLRAMAALPAGEALLWLFRGLAAFEILKGIVHWAGILGLFGAPFDQESLGFRAATIYFAVLDPAAGVGLWLTASWGVVLWLAAAASQLVLCLVLHRVFGHLWPLAAFEILALGAYLALTFRAAQEAEEG
ncbi:MAG TPA: DUF6163 family protein [Hyphomicrobiales bacterium]|nr:DUF6163 family protein [Hyphomicrobiales bacterium]